METLKEEIGSLEYRNGYLINKKTREIVYPQQSVEIKFQGNKMFANGVQVKEYSKNPPTKAPSWGSELGQILADFENNHDEERAVRCIKDLMDMEISQALTSERTRLLEGVRKEIKQIATDLINAQVDHDPEDLKDPKFNWNSALRQSAYKLEAWIIKPVETLIKGENLK